MANLKEMLKMNKKRGSKETEKENNEILNEENIVVTDKEAQEQEENPPVQEEKKEVEEKKEPTLQEKLDEANDRLLRLHAEFDNYRKRTIKERIELSKTASEDVITSMLPIVDDLERAIKSMESTDSNNSHGEGIVLIYNKLKNILTLKGLEEIKTVDEVFNTDFHEAITNIAVENEEMKGKIIDVIEKGYLLNGKVIRFAKVVVGS
jgi:molecular chaperone GrpE